MEFHSRYTLPFPDPDGILLNVSKDTDDASPALQDAINRVIAEHVTGIVYIPSGTYRIRQTVLIPRSVRLIGFGATRPVLLLPEHTHGFEERKPLLWFIKNPIHPGEEIHDADAGTFYSGLSNIDFVIEDGNPGAICVRAHFAQHGLISHCSFSIGQGFAGIYDVGNEMENLRFEGGDYGIFTHNCSPGWPFVLLDSAFTHQRKAAVATRETGFTGIRLQISNVPSAFVPLPDESASWEKLYLEDCMFSDITDAAICFHLENNSFNQYNLHNVFCHNVPFLIQKLDSNDTQMIPRTDYVVTDYRHGKCQSSATKASSFETICNYKPLTKLPSMPESDIPFLPDMTLWKSIRDYGAVGDGITDDTEALRLAIRSAKILYFPQGIYRITDTITMEENTQFIGLNPISTQILLADDTPAFSEFGTPKPLVETSHGFNIINGIGLDTAGKNPRAVGCKWMANEHSYMNDVKFVGGHGLMPKDGSNGYNYVYNASRNADFYADREWDFQYASLWITQDGGGVFKDIWSASPYAEAGIAITDTSTPGHMYCISLEHHVRNEIKLHNVSNWRFYALQTEEEKGEGPNCLPMELKACEQLFFANYFIFRTVFVEQPCDTAIRVWNSRDIMFCNLHNYTQMQYVFSNTLSDGNGQLAIRSWELAYLALADELIYTKTATPSHSSIPFLKLANGFTFACGAALDSAGNLTFCDKTHKRIYRYNVQEHKLELLFDIHFTPSSMFYDSKDHLIVAVDYKALRKKADNGAFSTIDWSNFHPYFSWFGKRGLRVYSIDPDAPYNSMQQLFPEKITGIRPQVIYHPAHYWYPDMYLDHMAKPVDTFYFAPDGQTALYACEDAARATSLIAAQNGQPMYSVDDGLNRVWRFDVSKDGNTVHPQLLAEHGRYGAFTAPDGSFYVADDQLYHHAADGTLLETIDLPDRITCMVGDYQNLFLLSQSSVYLMKL